MVHDFSARPQEFKLFQKCFEYLPITENESDFGWRLDIDRF